MNIDAGSFFILVGTLAAGGAAGYVASNKHLFEQPAPPAPSATATAPAIVPPLARPALPPCDDSVGTPGTCPPPVYSADETGCGPLPTKRCDDFKQTMKPKVAEHAVACLNTIQPAQRCDPLRLNLCAHLALMGACQEEDTDRDAADAAPPTASSLTTACQAILQECTAATIGPTLRDCRATLAGMTELGRTKMVDCMKAHCGDKGLLHCEAVIDVK